MICKNILMMSLALFVNFTFAQQDLRAKHFNLDKSGLALEGFDPMSYFLGSPKKGSEQFTLKHNGVTYRFANQRNLDLFKASPAKYEPAYGGWCAYAMGQSGEKVEVDPETYKIVNGRLFLFYHTFINNTLPKWNANEKKLNQSADENWLKIFK